MTEEEFLSKLNQVGFKRHIQRSSLVWNQKNYRIEPDEAFYYTDKVVLIEFEKNKRPVESISKYWWLYKNTDWKSNNVVLELHFVLIQSHGYDIRDESIQILGNDLAKQEVLFKFFYYS